MSYSFDCYRKVLFEQEIEDLLQKGRQRGGPVSLDINENTVIEYLEARLKEIKDKYKD